MIDNGRQLTQYAQRRGGLGEIQIMVTAAVRTPSGFNIHVKQKHRSTVS
jgi:hypothetical protein